MKVVLLAGGLGTRMREETEFRPKPMVDLGGKPVLWHIMKIYATYGHTEFIVCAGYKGEFIKNYFYNYAAMNMDFTLKLGNHGDAVFHGSHSEFDWTVTVADTGRHTPTGGRLKRIERFVGDESFLCTYGDGIAPVNIAGLLASHRNSGNVATITSARPPSRFGVVRVNEGLVEDFVEKPKMDSEVNIGFFVFEPEIFKFLREDSVLESEVLPEVAAIRKLGAFEHAGFWYPMDTQRELYALQELWAQPNPPWKIW